MQLSTGTPQEAREAERWVRDGGADYLDGAILACSPAGGLTYVGEQVGAAYALDCAALSFVFGALMGALHGARICAVEGLRVDEFGSMLAELLPVVGQEVPQLSERIRRTGMTDRRPGTAYSAAAMRLVQQARDSRSDADFPAYAAEALEQGMSAGLGNEDLAALIKVLRGGP